MGVVVLMADAVGLWAINSPLTRLSGMKAGVNLGLLTDLLGDSVAKVLSLLWTSLCVIAPSMYLAKRRYWRGLIAMLFVCVTSLSAFLGLLLFIVLATSVGAATR